jgi:GNAT superfamily N-acetyltransferase
MSIGIERMAGPTDEAAALIAELDAVLGAVYAPEQRHGLSLAQVFEPHVRFFIARRGGDAVGCGAVALFPDYAEVKRMYTREAARGRGVAKALLARLEQKRWPPGSRCCGWRRVPNRKRRSGCTRASAFANAPPSGITRHCRRTASAPASFTKSRCSRRAEKRSASRYHHTVQDRRIALCSSALRGFSEAPI